MEGLNMTIQGHVSKFYPNRYKIQFQFVNFNLFFINIKTPK